MGYLIASDDGRCRICVMTAAAAVSHMKRLNALGTAFHVTDAMGNQRELSELDTYNAPATDPLQI